VSRWTLVYSDGARSDLLAIADDIADQHSEANAEFAITSIERRIRTLERFPERGRVVPELHWHGITTVREVFARPWRILYQLGDDEVLVMAGYHERRRLDDVLLERFLR
jgi:toxin ParE1/3/4